MNSFSLSVWQIESLEDPNHRIRDLVQKRIVEFNKQIISGNMKNGMQVDQCGQWIKRDLYTVEIRVVDPDWFIPDPEPARKFRVPDTDPTHFF